MNGELAQFIRHVRPDEDIRSLADEAKALTWDHGCEHAVLTIETGGRVLVRGGFGAIRLEVAVPGNPFGRPDGSIWLDVDDEEVRVTSLVMHTHPRVTGPSDDDLRVLELLNQEESLLFEISGPPEGTIIRPKRRPQP